MTFDWLYELIGIEIILIELQMEKEQWEVESWTKNWRTTELNVELTANSTSKLWTNLARKSLISTKASCLPIQAGSDESEPTSARQLRNMASSFWDHFYLILTCLTISKGTKGLRIMKCLFRSSQPSFRFEVVGRTEVLWTSMHGKRWRGDDDISWNSDSWLQRDSFRWSYSLKSARDWFELQRKESHIWKWARGDFKGDQGIFLRKQNSPGGQSLKVSWITAFRKGQSFASLSRSSATEPEKQVSISSWSFW